MCWLKGVTQGKPNRSVPLDVIDNIRKQLEDSARHLIDMSTEDRIKRYARVTRVHVMSLLRNHKCGTYSRWYRESHYIHHVITDQPPPDISALETPLMVLFGVGIIMENTHTLRTQCVGVFFIVTAVASDKKKLKKKHKKKSTNKVQCPVREIVCSLWRWNCS